MTHDGCNLSGVDRHPGVHDRDWDQELNEYLIARDLVLPLAAVRNGDVPREPYAGLAGTPRRGHRRSCFKDGSFRFEG